MAAGTESYGTYSTVSWSTVSDREENKAGTDTASQQRNTTEEHFLRGLDGNYGRWDEMLREILNGQQNGKETDTDTEEDDDDVMPETTGRPTYDTSERNG